MNKKGILTFHYAHNVGAMLQAYAQYQLLESDMIDVRLPYYIDKQTKSPQKNIEFNQFIQNNFPLTEQHIETSYETSVDFINSLQKDILIVGSDELWKLREKPFPNIYWLGNNFKGKKVTCAVSANRLYYKELDTKILDSMGEKLSSFDLLGVRDIHTLEFLEFLGLKGEKVPDPTIAFNFENVKEICILPEGKKLGLRFILNANKKYYKTLINQFSSYTKYSFCIKNIFENTKLSHLTPFRWIDAISQMDFMITDSYHHAIFAMKYGIPFLCVEGNLQQKGYKSKMYDLLHDLDMLHCYTNSKKPSNPEVQIKNILKLHNPEETKKKLKIMENTYLQFANKVKNL